MKILDALLNGLSQDAAVQSVLVGAHYTLVCSRRCGLATTLVGSRPHVPDPVHDVGALHLRSARQLAELSRSGNPLEASIGVAAINSLLEVDDAHAVEINAAEVLKHHARGRRIALVGHFPFISKLREVASELWVIERNPVEGEHPAASAADLIPQADVVGITGSALINHTLDGLLALCRRDVPVIVLGPSTPLSPVLFDYGATIISGARVVDEEAVRRTISHGATFQQVQGVRLLTLARDSFRPART